MSAEWRSVAYIRMAKYMMCGLHSPPSLLKTTTANDSLLTTAIRRCYLHGVGRDIHGTVLGTVSTRVAKRNPLLVAGKFNELAQFLLKSMHVTSHSTCIQPL